MKMQCSFCKSEKNLHAFFVCNAATEDADEGIVICGDCLDVVIDMRDTLSADLSEYKTQPMDEPEAVPA